MDVLDLLIDGPSFEDLKRESVRDLLRTRANRAAASQPVFNPQPMVPAPAPMAPPPAQAAPGARALPRAMGGPPEPVPGAPEPAAGPDPLMAQFADLQRRQGEARGAVEQAYQPIDRSGAEEMYRKQSQQGGQGLLMALAAQEAGKEFAPVQAHFLKQASEAQAPMKMAGGTMTQSGFIEDPGYNQNLAVQRADAKLRQIDQALQQNLTAQERRRMEVERERAADERQAAMLAGREDLARLTAGLAAGGKSDRAAQAADARNDKRVDSIRKEYNTKLAKVEAGAGFADAVVTALSDPTLARNAPAQVALIMQFGKMLDPDSVVREAEQRMIAGARGFADSLMQTIPRIQTGALLTPQQLAQMRGVANQYRSGSAQRLNDVKTQYADLARRNSLPVEDIVLGGGGVAMPAGAVREKGATAAPATPTAGPPPGAVRERR